MEGRAEFRITDALTVDQNNRGYLLRLTVDRPQVGGAHRSMRLVGTKVVVGDDF